MKAAPFAFAAPRSIDEVVAILEQNGDEARLLAGGQSLVPIMAFRLATPSLLVDLNGVVGLEYARLAEGELVMGAMARHRTVQDLHGIADRCQLIADGLGLIGHPAIRNRGTVGGSLAHADPAAEWPAIAVALDATIDVVGPAGVRRIPAGELFAGHFTTTLEPAEVLTRVRISIPNGSRTGSAFVEVTRRHGDFAIVGVAALLGLSDDGVVDEARIALIGVRDVPVRLVSAEGLLRGLPPIDDHIAEAAMAVEADVDPISDLHASAEYRRHLARVLVGRALAAARNRAERSGRGG